MAVVVTVAKGYDLGYIWKNQVQASAERTICGYYINAAQAGEPPGRWWGPGAQALGFISGQIVLSKPSLVKIKSTLVRSIRRARKYDLIGKNVAELIDLPQGQPGHPPQAMTEEQASKVLQAAGGQPTGIVRVVKVTGGKYAATHAATESGELACGTWTRLEAPVTDIDTDLATTTCRVCRSELGLDVDVNANRRLEALFVLSITLGLRPGELRKLSWDHVDLDNAVIHVWRSASRTGDVKTPKSKRSLVLPKRAVVPLQEIGDTVGHKSTHVTETVCRHVIVPAIRGGGMVMDAVFGDADDAGNGDGQTGTGAGTAP